MTRKDLLKRQYGLTPRNEVTRGSYHVGWNLDQNYQACIFWIDPGPFVLSYPTNATVNRAWGRSEGVFAVLAGKPFVGPVGLMLDRAPERAGIDRKKPYVTNAVKHFKFVPRGKFPLHQKPTTPEIKACRPWYDRELAALKPDLVVAMGATAAQSGFGKITPINKHRGRLIDTAAG